MENTIKKYIFIALTNYSCIQVNAQTITIDRRYETNECTMGYLSIGTNIICNTLERAEFANSKKSSRIPLGTYNAFIRKDGNLGWRIELTNVPNRDYIQIHLGNYPFQTTGCTLVGTAATPKNCTVQNSTLALDKIKNALSTLSQEIDLTRNSTQAYSIKVIYK